MDMLISYGHIEKRNKKPDVLMILTWLCRFKVCKVSTHFNFTFSVCGFLSAHL